MENNEDAKMDNEGFEKKSLQTTIAVPPFLLGNETTTQTTTPITTTPSTGGGNDSDVDTGKETDKQE